MELCPTPTIISWHGSRNQGQDYVYMLKRWCPVAVFVMASVVVLSLEMRFYSAFIGCPKLCLSTHTRLLHNNTAETLLSDDRRHNTMTDMTWAADGERIELKVVCQHGSIMSLIPCRRSRTHILLLHVLCLVTVQVTSLQHGENVSVPVVVAKKVISLKAHQDQPASMRRQAKQRPDMIQAAIRSTSYVGGGGGPGSTYFCSVCMCAICLR